MSDDARASLERDRAVDEVPESGRHVSLEASEETRAALAEPAGVDAVERLDARRSTSRRRGRTACMSQGRVQRDGAADLRGLARADGQHDRRGGRCGFRAAAQRRAKRCPTRSSSMPSAGEEPEPLIGNSVDLGLLATEFLILGIDPYPRKPDAAFEAAGCRRRGRAPVRGARRMEKKGHGQGITSDPGALCVRHAEPLWSGQRGVAASRQQDGLPGRTWPKRSELRSMPWGATSGLRSWFPAPISRLPATPTPNSSCSATRPWSRRCSTRGRG